MLKRIYVEPTEASSIYEREFPTSFKILFGSKDKRSFYILAGVLIYLFHVAVCAVCAFGMMLIIARGLGFLSDVFGFSSTVLGAGLIISLIFVGGGLLYVISISGSYFRYMAVELEERRFARKENLPHEKFSVTILGQHEDSLTWLNLEDIKSQRIRIQVTPIEENSSVVCRKKCPDVIQEKKINNHRFLKFILLSFPLFFLGSLPDLFNSELQWLSKILTSIAAGLVVYFTLKSWSKHGKKKEEEKNTR